MVIVMTDVKADNSSNHAKFAQLAEIAPEMREVLARGVATQGESDTAKGQGTLASVVEGPGGLVRPSGSYVGTNRSSDECLRL